MEAPNFTEDLVTFSRFEHTFKVPGKDKLHSFRLGTLLVNEMDEVYENTSRFATDDTYRNRLIRKEILSRAILQIDDIEFKTPESRRMLKNRILDYMTDASINHVYTCYQAMMEVQGDYILGTLTVRDATIDWKKLLDGVSNLDAFNKEEVETLKNRFDLTDEEIDKAINKSAKEKEAIKLKEEKLKEQEEIEAKTEDENII